MGPARKQPEDVLGADDRAGRELFFQRLAFRRGVPQGEGPPEQPGAHLHRQEKGTGLARQRFHGRHLVHGAF